jgi:hypothetical protein
MNMRPMFFSLALLLTTGIFSTTACSQQAAPKMENGNMTELIKTDVKLGTGDVATAGKNVSVHYTGWLYDAAAMDHHGKKFDRCGCRGHEDRRAAHVDYSGQHGLWGTRRGWGDSTERNAGV